MQRLKCRRTVALADCLVSQRLRGRILLRARNKTCAFAKPWEADRTVLRRLVPHHAMHLRDKAFLRTYDGSLQA